MIRSFKTEGIILKRNNFGESDKVLTIFTKHSGKISVIAKGIRRTTSRKGGNLELFNQVRIFVAKGKNLDIVTEAEVIKTFKEWRGDLKKVAVAYHLCELVDKLSAEGVENDEVYEMLENYLSNIATITNLPRQGESKAGYELLITNFEVSLLQALGFWPRGRAIGNLDLDGYIEDLINRKLYAKKFFRRVSGSG